MVFPESVLSVRRMALSLFFKTWSTSKRNAFTTPFLFFAFTVKPTFQNIEQEYQGKSVFIAWVAGKEREGYLTPFPVNRFNTLEKGVFFRMPAPQKGRETA